MSRSRPDRGASRDSKQRQRQIRTIVALSTAVVLWVAANALWDVSYGVNSAIGLTLFVSFAVLRRVLMPRLDYGMPALARELGLSYHRGEPPGLAHALDSFAIAREPDAPKYGGAPRVGPSLSGEIEGHEVYVAAFHWRGSRKRYKVTLVAVRKDDWHLPRILVRPEGIADKLVAVVGGQDVDFPRDPEFSSSYVVKGSDEKAVRQALDDEIRARIARLSDAELEAEGSTVAVYWERPPDAEEVKDRLPHILGLVRSLAGG